MTQGFSFDDAMRPAPSSERKSRTEGFSFAEALKPPEPNSIWTDAADFSKRMLASTLGGVAGAPLGAEQAVKGAARSAMEGTPEAIMPASVYQPGLDTEETLFGPESKEERAQRRLGAQRAVAQMPNLPGARSLNELGKEVQKSIEGSVSEQTKRAIKESTPEGNIFKGELSLGENPTLRGYAMQGASVFGSLLPVVVTAIATKSPTAAGGVGGAMAAEEAANSAAEYIRKLPHEKLLEASPFYASLINAGASEKEARDLATRKAAETGAVLQGMVATLGDRFTGKLVTGAFDDMLRKAAGKSVIARTGAGATLSAGEEAIQEVAEGVAADVALQNVVKSKEIGEESAANLILGAIGGGAPGGARGFVGGVRDKLAARTQGRATPSRTVLDTLSEEDDVAGFDTTAVGAGAGVAGVPEAPTGAAGAEGVKPDGVVSARPPAGELVGGEGAEPGPVIPLTADFRQQYNDLRQEIVGLLSLNNPTQADLSQLKFAQKDLDALVDSNADAINAASGDPRLTQVPSKKFALTLKNPMFDGSKLLSDIETAQQEPGEARAMAGDLFGGRVGMIDLPNRALSIAGQDPVKAVSYLEGLVQRTKERLPAISKDSDWGRRMAAAVGLSNREGFENPAKVAELYVAKLEGAVADAVTTVQSKGKARGMAGKLFGDSVNPGELLNQALAIANDDPAQAIQRLQTLLKRTQDQLPELSKDSGWGRKTARSVGMTEQQGAADPGKVARLFTMQKVRAINEAINAARGVDTQNDMFGAESEDQTTQERVRAGEKSRKVKAGAIKQSGQEATTAGATPELFSSAVDELETMFTPKKRTAPTEEFGAPVGKEAPEPTAEQLQAEAEQEQRRRAAKEVVEAPEVSTERVLETPAGGLIKRFFDLIQPANPSQSELSKHQASKNSAANTLLEYDIARPGQKDLPGLQKALQYLVDKVGGRDKFAALLESLDGATPAEQANLLRRAGLPDLTSRRGIDSFRDTVQLEVQALTAKGEGVKLPTKSIPSKVTGTPIPYREELNTGVSEYVPREPEQGTGKPRRPLMREFARQFVISDTKIRTAARLLRELVNARAKLTDAAEAAATYFSNPVRSTFGEALNDLAFDLAMREIEPDNYGAGSTFPGEGGKYALQFQEWIKANLDQNTVELLDELIEMHSETARQNAAYGDAVSRYKVAQKEYAEQQRQKVEKTSGVKMPKAPITKKQVPETEAGEQEAELEIPKVPTKNLPRRQAIYEVHPAIKRALETGDTRRALELLSEAQSNPYYALLADRLLAANITAKTTFIDQDTLQPLNEPNNDTFDNYINTLSEMIVEMYPVDQQASLVTLLKSGRLRDVTTALAEMRATLTTTKATDGQIEVFNQAVTYFNEQYGWLAKYDPNTDTLVFRQNTGLTNATFLHEVLHAATAGLIDNADSLTGIQRQGYDQLMELYNYSKGMLSQDGFAVEHIYGLKDLHEFVSEALTNPEFQAQLRALRYKASPFSLANWFTEGIRKLFNIKKGYESNVLNEVIFASDAMMLGTTAGKEKLVGTTGAKAAPGPGVPNIPKGRPNIPGANKAMFNALMKPKNWNQVRPLWPIFYANLKANVRPSYLGALTLDQLADLVNKRLPQLDNFIRVTNDFLSRKNSIVTEAADISKRWEHLQARNPDMSVKLGGVMHISTIREFDPDPLVPSTAAERAKNADVLKMWKGLSPEARAIYREVRNFYERRYSEYRTTLDSRLSGMSAYGVSATTINDIRAEFDKAKRKGPYFPLMRRGRFAYQIGSGQNREYYMFESLGERELHLQQRLAADPYLRSTVQSFNDYKEGMDEHARESNFLRTTFEAIDTANFAGTPADEAARKQELKDNVYQTWLANQPESSFRNRFVHRTNIEGFSQDALRNFSTSAFHMAYQLSRFEHSPEMFSQLQAAKQQLKGRFDPANPADPVVMRENNELSDYVREAERRLTLILNPTDVGTFPSTLSNIGFIWYLSSFGSAAANILGGMIIGLPTIVGQIVRNDPSMSYSRATLSAMSQMKTVFGQIMMTGFDYETGPRIRDFSLKSPSLQRSSKLTPEQQAAYDRFVADGLIDITGTYDMSGLASKPTENYSGLPNKGMQVITYLFHNAERLNREIIAMSAFNAAMEKRASMPDRAKAFAESIQEAKNTTNASMFNYSSTNKPRWFQNPVARVVLQFKQFPQQMTWFLSRSLWKSFADADPAVRREARARFVGTMGMTAIFSGTTGLWGFSTVASIVNACAALFGDDDEEPFDFELEFKNWVVETFGKNLGTAVSSGVFNAAGIDLGSRVKLDDMWFRDNRKNQDEVDAVTAKMIELLGPVVGLVPTAAQAVKLWNQGHPDRALETLAPAFVKNPLIAYRYSKEGVNTLSGDPLMEDMGPFLLLMQSLGIRSAELAERQYYNITKKGQAEEIRTRRTNLLNGFAITFMSNDVEGVDKALDKIMEFNDKYPSVRIPMKSISRSIKERLEKSAQTDHGLYIDPRLRDILLNERYMDTDED